MTSNATLSTAVVAPPVEPLGKGSLVRAEVHRLTARRFIRWLVALAAVAYVVVCAIASTQFSRPTPELLAEARQRMDQAISQEQQFREECLNDPQIPEGQEDNFCGPPPGADTFRVEDFLAEQPFRLATDLPNGAIAVGIATAGLMFLVGATYIGAEWSSRSIVALLFWEPRRLKVMAVKIGVLTGATVLLGVLAQAVWFGTAQLLARTRGTTGGLPADFWADLVGQQGRLVLLGVLAALVGFGVANLLRNTAAALGFGFIYFVIVEMAVRIFRPTWQEWLLTDNAAALVLNGGFPIYIYGEGNVDEQGMHVDNGREILLSNLHGGLVLGAVTAVVLAAGVLLFKRRDLQ